MIRAQVKSGAGVRCDWLGWRTDRFVTVGRARLGNVTVVLNFLHLYTICLTVDLWSPNSF